MPPPAASARDSRVVLALGIVYVVWGSTYLGIRWALETIPPFTMASARYLVAGGVLLAWVKARGAPACHAPRPPPGFPHGRASCSSAATAASCGPSSGSRPASPRSSSRSSRSSSSSSRPRSRRSAGARRGARSSASRSASSASSSSSAPWASAGSASDLAGAGAVLFAAFAWALGSLLSRHFARPASPLQATALQMLAGGALLGGASGVAGEWSRFSPSLVSAKSLAAVAYLVVFGSLVAFTAYIWLLAPPRPRSSRRTRS